MRNTCVLLHIDYARHVQLTPPRLLGSLIRAAEPQTVTHPGGKNAAQKVWADAAGSQASEASGAAGCDGNSGQAEYHETATATVQPNIGDAWRHGRT
jgi:hypothetical protein